MGKFKMQTLFAFRIIYTYNLNIIALVNPLEFVQNATNKTIGPIKNGKITQNKMEINNSERKKTHSLNEIQF